LARRRKKNIGWKIIIAILAFIGILFIIDKLAGTSILETLYSRFIDFIHWLQGVIS